MATIKPPCPGQAVAGEYHIEKFAPFQIGRGLKEHKYSFEPINPPIIAVVIIEEASSSPSGTSLRLSSRVNYGKRSQKPQRDHEAKAGNGYGSDV